ncbi:MAG: hypothetical protein LBH09_04340, partial [Peptococcaceae bacterium]|nr:hypothetical protein [Peptococcaceae bacterium]
NADTVRNADFDIDGYADSDSYADSSKRTDRHGKNADVPDDQVVIQGTIDVYFAEEDRLILADYKSDRIEPGNEGELLRRYQGQLLLYAEGLEAFTGKQATELMLYSLVLGKEIHLKR